MKTKKPPARIRTRSFQGFTDKPGMYQGEVPVPARAQDAGSHPALAKLDIGELRFLRLYAKTGCMMRAYRLLRKKNVLDVTAQSAGSRIWGRIKRKLSQEEIYEVVGLSAIKVARVFADAMDAEAKKEFVDREGRVVCGEPFPDHPTRIAAAKEAAKVLRLTDAADQSFTVNLIMYGDPSAPRWTGSNDEIVNVPPGEERCED